MKKKFLLGSAVGLFAVAIVFSFNLSNANGIGDVALDDIAVMAQAQDENDGNDDKEEPCGTCGYWKENVFCIRFFASTENKGKAWICTGNRDRCEQGGPEVNCQSTDCCQGS